MSSARVILESTRHVSSCPAKQKAEYSVNKRSQLDVNGFWVREASQLPTTIRWDEFRNSISCFLPRNRHETRWVPKLSCRQRHATGWSLLWFPGLGKRIANVSTLCEESECFAIRKRAVLSCGRPKSSSAHSQAAIEVALMLLLYC